MCSRYYIDNSVTIPILKKYRFASLLSNFSREICPEQLAPLMMWKNDEVILVEMHWGMQTRSGLVINARAETVLGKYMFRENILRRRCIIPARHFYEWDESRNKAAFSSANGDTIYMAGIFDMSQSDNRFVILTTQANASVAPIHDRMPLTLTEKEIIPWLCDLETVPAFLKKIPESLQKTQEYEQQSLFQV